MRVLYVSEVPRLTMLGLYLDSRTIGHTFCSVISILKDLALQKGIAKNV